MTTEARRRSAAHEYWHRKVEGQIRHTIGRHPRWFNVPTKQVYRNVVLGLAKRIVGEIVAGCLTVSATSDADGSNCPRCGLAGVVVTAASAPDRRALRVPRSGLAEEEGVRDGA